jgi:protein TonB
MTSNEILKADMLDILFDNRNKQYGAYTLRKYYNNRLSLALILALGSILLLALLMKLDLAGPNIIQKSGHEVIVHPYSVPPEVKKPKPLIKQNNPASQPPARQRIFSTTLIKPEVTTHVTPQSMLTGTAISTSNIDNGQDIVPTIKGPEGNPNGRIDANQNNTTAILEKEPEFPGGQEAWLNFLRKNLVAPDNLEAGEKKTVQVRFIVAMDGTVTSFEILQSAGKSFDNEVIRVLKKMPRWRPAIQNGQATTKAFMQPVTFIGVEQ